MKIPCYFQVRNSWFLCNHPNGPLKASGRPSVFRSFSRCSCPDDRATPFGTNGKIYVASSSSVQASMEPMVAESMATLQVVEFAVVGVW